MLLASMAAALLAAACKEAPAPVNDARADPRDAAQVASGGLLYAQHCAACHGARLEGQPDWRRRRADGRLPAPPHDENGHTWHHTDALLFAITKKGLIPPHAPAGYASDMPAFSAILKDEEIWAVLAYIKSHWTSREVAAARDQLEKQTRQR